MNIIAAYEQGQKGQNKGLPMGAGLAKLSAALNDIQRGRIYTLAAAAKGGKSTLADVGFVIEPCVYVLDRNAIWDIKLAEISQELQTTITPERREELNTLYEECQVNRIDLEIIYNSYEIDRVSKEFDFITHFINRDFNVVDITLPSGKMYKGKGVVPLSSDYLRGELCYDNEDPTKDKETITVPKDVFEMIKITYKRRIIPLFGEFNSQGVQVSKGLITFLETKDNPTGIRNFLIAFAKKNGEFMYSPYVKEGVTHQRMIGYKPNNPKKYVIVLTDHLRKLQPERGFDMKKTVDKFSEYAVELRNTCNFSFVHIIHLNRSMADVSRRKLDDDKMFPQAEDIKETGREKYYLFFLCFSSLFLVVHLYN